MKKFLTVALAGVLAASMLFTGCSKKEESKVPDKLIVGTNAEFPPFEYMNDAWASRAARPSARRSGTRRPNPPMELTNHHRCGPSASNEAS